MSCLGSYCGRFPDVLRPLAIAIGALALALPALLRAQEIWTPIASPTTQNLWSVCSGGGQFVAVGEGGTILTSPDGVAWTKRASGNSLWLVGVGYGNGLFVVVGDQGTILTSSDGVAWTTRRTGGTRINAVAYGNGFFLAVDEGGGGWYSSDGLTWSFHGSIASAQLRGLVYASPLFVITGSNGTIATTFDGNVFTGRTSGTTTFLESVAYGRRGYVAIGAAGATFTSRDTAAWRGQPNANAYFHGVGFFNNQFVGVDDHGAVATSFDGSAWTSGPTGTNQLLIAIAADAGDTAAVVVGFGGTILRSNAARRAPAIVTPPTGVTEAVGNNVQFTVAASGTTPLAYQWSFNGAPIAGATTDALLLSAIGAAQAGAYSVAVTNALGTATAVGSLSVVASFAAPTGIVDPTFSPTPAPTSVPATALEQPDGRVLLGGSFIYLVNGVAQSGIARLNADGALDATFRAGVGIAGPNSAVAALALQADGKVLVGGTFTSIAGLARGNLARLNADGSPDPAFAPPAFLGTVSVQQILVQQDGKILVRAGLGLYRVDAGGALDPGFADLSGAQIYPVAIDLTPAGKIVVATFPGTLVSNLLQLNSDGTRDSGFTTTSTNSSEIVFLRALPSGRILLGGLAGVASRSWLIRRHNPDGTIDPTYQAAGGSALGGGSIGVPALAVDADGRAVYYFANPVPSVPGSITRLEAEGIIDPTLRLAGSQYPSVSRIVPLSGGRLLMLGEFTSFDGVPRTRLVRTLPNNAPAINPPVIAATVPSVINARAGDSLAIAITTAGTGPFSYSVSPAGSLTSGVLTTGVLTLPDVQQTASYMVTVSNPAGTTKSVPIVVFVTPSVPRVLSAPLTQSVNSGRTAVFTVDARGSGTLSYQWFYGATPIGTNSPTLTMANVSAANAGLYTVVIRNSLGTTTVQATLTVDDTSRLANISTRGFSGGGENVLTAGFAVSGPTSKTVLLRGIGPSLVPFGVTGVLPNPKLALFDSTGVKFAENDDWRGDSAVATAARQAGAFALPADSLDSALLVTLKPGIYTAQLTDATGGSGIGLIEVYEADLQPSRLVNLSSRLAVGSGLAVAIPGLNVSGPVPRKLLIRAVGPTLAGFGVQNPLADPSLTLVDAGGVTLAANDNWSSAANANEIVATSAKLGAFALPTLSKDAVLLVTLPPGAYTALVGGANGTSGIALVEVYEVP